MGKGTDVGSRASTRPGLDGVGGLTDDLRGKIPAFGISQELSDEG
jgi:hypothetical protein